MLDALPAVVELLPGKSDHVEGIHDRGDGVDRFDGGGLVAGESVHRHDLDPVPERCGLGLEPGLERGLGAALDDGQQAGDCRRFG